jgi:hypothetical protein
MSSETEAEERQCHSCGKLDSETVLLEIILPPTIMEPPCLRIAIDDSTKKGKAAQ